MANLISHRGSMAIKLNLLCTQNVFAVHWLHVLFSHFPRQITIKAFGSYFLSPTTFYSHSVQFLTPQIIGHFFATNDVFDSNGNQFNEWTECASTVHRRLSCTPSTFCVLYFQMHFSLNETIRRNRKLCAIP